MKIRSSYSMYPEKKKFLVYTNQICRYSPKEVYEPSFRTLDYVLLLDLNRTDFRVSQC